MHRRGRGNFYGYGGTSDRSFVSKSFERIIKARLEVFASSSEPELKLEPMTREERRVVHAAAQKCGLQSRSTGKEPNRIMTITRPPAQVCHTASLCETDAITLDHVQEGIVEGFLERNPVTFHELRQHREHHRRFHRRTNSGGTYADEAMPIPKHPNTTAEMKCFRELLPTHERRKEILDKIEDHRVTLITGGTGCGKTTQVPQFLLEDAAEKQKRIRIIVTQPRRLPAIAVSERVSKERNERIGDTVGYHIRLEQKVSKDTVLTYCTSGVLLRMLTVNENASDVSHIILDEIHEREQNTDYLLIALKQALKRRPDLKVILMSATMEGNRNMFLNYFGDNVVGHVDIPARLFEVERFFLAEVLALTDYTPPDSGFGGMFSDIFPGGFGNKRGFPPVGHFNENNNLTNVQTEPNLSNMATTSLHPSASASAIYSNENGYAAQQNGYYGNGWDATSYADVPSSSNTWTNGFGPEVFHIGEQHPTFYVQQESFIQEPQRKGVTQLSNRPPAFTPQFTPTFRNIQLDEHTLIDNYIGSGGQQWADSIDPDLTVHVIRYCMDSEVDGSILVFLPGYEDILTVREKVLRELDSCRTRAEVFTLHSQMNSADQQRVFEKIYGNKRKVILSTNIAEASLTIDDVVFVVDCGKVKEKTYDHNSRYSQLQVTWIAKSNAEQRSGRAGRCRKGYCFRLYSKEEHDNLLLCQVPEMKRSAIHEVCLHAKMFAPENISVQKFLEMAPEPPTSESIDQSMQFLEILGALTGERDVSGKYKNEPDMTELGRHLAHLPLDPQLARLLLFGVALKCVGPIITLVASLAHRDPFVLPLGEDRNAALTARDDFSHCDYSDHIMLIRAFNAYNQIAPTNNRQYQFCRNKFLSANTMKMIQGISRQLVAELKRLKMMYRHQYIDDPELNRYSKCWPMIQAAIVAGCYPGIGVVRSGAKLKKIRTCSNNQTASLHPGCVIKRQMGPCRRSDKMQSYMGDSVDEPRVEYLAYQELSKIDEGITIRTVTAVPPATVVLFAGSVRMPESQVEEFRLKDNHEEDAADLPFDPSTRNVFHKIDDGLVVKGAYKYFRKLMRVRVKFMTYFMEVMRNPGRHDTAQDKDLLHCLSRLLEQDHKRSGFYSCDDLPEMRSSRNRNDSTAAESPRYYENPATAPPSPPAPVVNGYHRSQQVVRHHPQEQPERFAEPTPSYAPPERISPQPRPPDVDPEEMFKQRQLEDWGISNFNPDNPAFRKHKQRTYFNGRGGNSNVQPVRIVEQVPDVRYQPQSSSQRGSHFRQFDTRNNVQQPPPAPQPRAPDCNPEEMFQNLNDDWGETPSSFNPNAPPPRRGNYERGRGNGRGRAMAYRRNDRNDYNTSRNSQDGSNRNNHNGNHHYQPPPRGQPHNVGSYTRDMPLGGSRRPQYPSVQAQNHHQAPQQSQVPSQPRVTHQVQPRMPPSRQLPPPSEPVVEQRPPPEEDRFAYQPFLNTNPANSPSGRYARTKKKPTYYTDSTTYRMKEEEQLQRERQQNQASAPPSRPNGFGNSHHNNTRR